MYLPSCPTSEQAPPADAQIHAAPCSASSPGKRCPPATFLLLGLERAKEKTKTQPNLLQDDSIKWRILMQHLSSPYFLNIPSRP
ncbi:hypothetical protein Y1Q_0002129 [Alligator mississippiensis]|uniref:Uncharacterized protein n=1 Tax=Alligator mississippiensis TaxID=8496 RepID=A0A151MPN1_ALLMI|nr:hypothetical protein Y1Q_0002129 [Alligator mississippiensis]